MATLKAVRAQHVALSSEAAGILQGHPFRCDKPTSSEMYDDPAVSRTRSGWLSQRRRIAGMAAVVLSIQCPNDSLIELAGSPEGQEVGFLGKTRRFTGLELRWGSFELVDGLAKMRGIAITTVTRLAHEKLRSRSYFTIPPESAQ